MGESNRRNNYAISTADLAQSLTKSSASLVAAGGDLAEAAALTATANKIIQDADSVGTALKTTSLRLRGTDVSVLEEEGLDSDGAVTSKSKLQSKVKALSGVDILTATGEYKSTYEILSQIADVWSDINDMDQAALLELLAGKRNSSVLAAILQNPEELKAAYEDANNAAGSALKENEKYLDSIQGKIDQFNNALQSMWNNTLNSDLVKLFVNFGTVLVKTIDSVGLLQTALFGLFTYLSNRKDSNLDFASMLGIHDKEKGWTIGQEGFTGLVKNAPGKIKEKFKKKTIVEDIVGDPEDIKLDAKEYAEAITSNISDYVKVDTSQIDTQIEDVQNKLMRAREQLDDARSADWKFYKSMGSKTPAKDRDNRITEKKDEILTLEKQLTELQTQRGEIMSDATLKYVDANINGIKAETQAQRSLFDATNKVKNVKLSIGNEQDAALKIDQINQAASQGQVALSQYAATLGDGDMALQAYIASLDGESASLAGFNKFTQQHNSLIKKSGIAAKAAAVGHALLNAAISMGVSLLISGAISAITSLINKHQELAKVAEEALSQYSNSISKLREHYDIIEDIKKDYENLADGVDDLGNNVGLTIEEFERYNEIANQIGDMFPDMISGYTAEGNAIIALKGNVEALTDAYEAEAQAARDALLLKSNDIFSAFKANTTDTEFWSGKSKVDKLEFFEKFATGQGTLDDVKKWVDEDMGTAPFDGILEDAGIYSTNWFSSNKDFYNALINNREQAQAYYRTLKAEIDAEATSVKQLAHVYLENDSSYSTLPSETKNIIAKTVDSFTSEFYTQFDNATQMNDWITTNLVQPLQNSDTSTAFKTTFDLQTSFNKGEVSVSDYLSQLSNFQQTLRDLGVDEEIIKSVLLLFNTEGLDAKQNVAKDFLLDEFDANVGQLTKTDLDIVDKYAKEFEEDMSGVGYTWDAFIAKINEKKLIDAFDPQDFEKISDGLDSIQNAYNSLSDAVEQYNNTGYLTLDSLQAILSLEPEYLALLQMENGQLSINQTAAEAMIQAKLAEAEANAIQSAMTQLETLGKEAATKATNDNAAAATNAITSLGNYSSALGTVAQDAIVAAGAVSALNNAVDGAKESGVSEEDINAVMSNLDTYLSLINTTRQNLSSSFVPIVTGGEGGNPEKEQNDNKIEDGWEALVSKYENQLALIKNERDLIQAEIDEAEARGGKASAEYYEDLIRTSTEERNLLVRQYNAMKDYLDANADTIEQDTWTEYNNSLNEIAVSIKECTTNTIQWKEALREIDIHYFEQATEEISRLGQELEFVDSLLEDEDVADENGNWSSAALTRMGIYMNQIESAAADTQRYQDEIAKLEKQYKNGELSEEQYQERLGTLTDGLYDSINAQEDARDSIIELNEARIDAIKEGIEKEIEAYEDLIDAKKEELDAERDLYEFRKDTQKQSKNIQELERRIAALSGSSAASDVAERRRLEAQLMEAKEGLNDSYYSHSRDAQSSALDNEAEAYRESQERRIEALEETLDNVELLIQNSMMDVLFNADIVYNELNGIADTYGITLSDELTQPWKDASAQATAWKNELQTKMTSGEYAALISQGGAITVFANGVGEKLSGSWNTAKTAVKNYSDFLTGTELGNNFSETITGFGEQIQTIIDKWNGVKTAADEAYQAQLRVQNVAGGNVSGNSNTTPNVASTVADVINTVTSAIAPAASVDNKILSKYKLTTAQVLALGYGPINLVKFEQLLRDYQIKYSSKYKQVANTRDDERRFKKVMYGEYVSGPFAVGQYAKGTTGTTRDEWAITDEPRFGDELVLVPGKDGNLSFMRKGTGVVPADLTANLMEWGQFTPDSMNIGGGVNINMINNAVNKPEFNFAFDALVKAENITEETLPAVKKLVTQELNRFTKELNYALKGKGAR